MQNWQGHMPGGMAIEDIVKAEYADESVEEARAHVVEMLRARGIEGDVTVDVEDVPGGRKIKVGVRQELGDTDGDASGLEGEHGERRIKLRRLETDDGRRVEEDVEIDERRVVEN